MKTVEVAPYRVPVSAWGGGYMAYRLTPEGEEPLDWIWGIDGFDSFAWGTVYRLKVHEETVTNPPPDTPARHFILVNILETRPAPAAGTFELLLKTRFDTFIKPGGTDLEWSLMEEVSFRLDTEEGHRRLLALMASASEVTGIFSISPMGDGSCRLILHDTRYDFDPGAAMDAYSRLVGKPPEDAWEWPPERFIQILAGSME